MPKACYEIINTIENKYPLNLAEEYDNVGLLIGDYGKVINKILVCLDITEKVIDEAIILKADMIVSHHPLLFKPIKRIVSGKGSFISDMIIKILKHDLCIYALHTNFDNADEGMNDILAELLELQNIKKLTTYAGRYGILLNKMFLNEFCDYLKNKLNVNLLRVIGDLNSEINSVAVVGGSGSDFIEYANALNCDVIVTGDVKHHTALDGLNSCINIIDAGHFFTEIAAMPYLASYLYNTLGIETILTRIDTNPFKNV